ncbi:MAG: murein biosynthesis integral membrane protein MurJ, partial [Acidobacteriaceae bacterium]
IAAWVEFFLLRRKMRRRIGAVDFSPALILKLWIAAAIAAGIAFFAKHRIHYLARTDHPLIIAVYILVPYGLIYLLLTHLFRVPQAKALLGRMRRG